AFEARIYAEDPARDFLPAIGRLHVLAFPEAAAHATVRVETGVAQGDEISPYYDPMIAKLVVHGSDRATALSGLAEALRNTRIAGATANIGFLHAPATDADFAAGTVDTGMIERKQAALVAAPSADDHAIAEALLAATGFDTPP